VKKKTKNQKVIFKYFVSLASSSTFCNCANNGFESVQVALQVFVVGVISTDSQRVCEVPCIVSIPFHQIVNAEETKLKKHFTDFFTVSNTSSSEAYPHENSGILFLFS
jgi:hypothetical protein